PITHEEYYKVFAIFNQTEDADRGDNAPNLTITSLADEQRKKQLGERIAALEKQLGQPDTKIDAAQEQWEKTVKPDKLPPAIQALLKLPKEARTPANRTELTKYFRGIAPETKATRDQIAALKKEQAAAAGINTPIMRELSSKS